MDQKPIIYYNIQPGSFAERISRNREMELGQLKESQKFQSNNIISQSQNAQNQNEMIFRTNDLVQQFRQSMESETSKRNQRILYPKSMCQSPEKQREIYQEKQEIVDKLGLTKNPNLYSYKELKNYNHFSEYIKKDQEVHKDKNMNLRTDDIRGAQNQRFHSNKNGIKTSDFFPENPDRNRYFNKMNKGLSKDLILPDIEYPSIHEHNYLQQQLNLNRNQQDQTSKNYMLQNQEQQYQDEPYPNKNINRNQSIQNSQERLLNINQLNHQYLNENQQNFKDYHKANNVFNNNNQLDPSQIRLRGNQTQLQQVYQNNQSQKEFLKNNTYGKGHYRGRSDRFQNNQYSTRNPLIGDLGMMNPEEFSPERIINNDIFLKNRIRKVNPIYASQLHQSQVLQDQYKYVDKSTKEGQQMIQDTLYNASSKEYGNYIKGEDLQKILDKVKRRREALDYK